MNARIDKVKKILMGDGVFTSGEIKRAKEDAVAIIEYQAREIERLEELTINQEAAARYIASQLKGKK